MSTIDATRADEVAEEVVAIVRDNAGKLNAAEVLDQLRRRFGVPEAAAYKVIWELITAKKLELTADRQLVAH